MNRLMTVTSINSYKDTITFELEGQDNTNWSLIAEFPKTAVPKWLIGESVGIVFPETSTDRMPKKRKLRESK